MSDPLPGVAACRASNALQPISSLPNEVLSLIFVFAVGHEPKFMDGDLTWITLFHVCYRWYQIGINMATLWTTVKLTGGKECVKEMLRRSKDLPLDACVNHLKHDPNSGAVFPSTRDSEAVTEMLEELPRIQRLSLAFAYHQWKPKPIVESPKMLKWFNMQMCYGCNLRRPADRGAFDISSDWPFSVDLPNLRTLKLEVDWNLHGVLRLQSLRSLELYISQTGRTIYEYSCDVRDLLESVRSMPCLENVKLGYVLGLDFTDNSDYTLYRPAYLAKLKSFEISDIGLGAARFLDLLGFPVTTSLFVNTEFFAEDQDEIEELIASLARKFTNTLPDGTQEHRIVRSLAVKTTVFGQFAPARVLLFSGCTHTHERLGAKAYERGGECPRPNFSVKIGYCHDHEWRRLVGFSGLFRSLPLQNVRTLLLKGSETYHSMLVHLGVLHWMHVDGPTSEAPRAYHFHDPRSGGPTLQEIEDLRPVLPNLTTLDLDLTRPKGIMAQHRLRSLSQ